MLKPRSEAVPDLGLLELLIGSLYVFSTEMEDLTAEEKVEEAENSAEDEAESSAEDEYEAESSAEEEQSLAESERQERRGQEAPLTRRW